MRDNACELDYVSLLILNRMKKTLKQINGEMVALNSQISREQDATKKAELVAQFEELEREAKIARDAEQAAINARQMRSLRPAKSARKWFRELIDRAMGKKDGIDLMREDETPSAGGGGGDDSGSGGAAAEEETETVTLSAGVSSSVLNTSETNNITSSGAIPKVIKNLLNILQNKLVYNQVGLQMSTGVKGEIVWPVLAAGATVTVEDEAAEVGDSTLNFSKIVAIPKRVAVTTDVTNEALEDASFDLQGVVVNNFTEGVKQLLNSALLRTSAVSDGLDGPFTVYGIEAETLSATPTYAELMQMKGDVAGNNVAMIAPAFVMNSKMFSALEAAPKAEGQGGFIIENGKIGPYPAIECNAFEDDQVGFGDFAYAALNQHGGVHLIVDPYTKATSNKVRITLNTRFSLTTLRKEAFCLGTCQAANAGGGTE